MIYRSKKHYLLPGLIISGILLILLLNLVIKPELTIKTFCEVFPKEKWILTRGTNGQIVSSMIDYTSGHTVEYNLNQFERGEYISLKFKLKGDRDKYIDKGDTIVSMSSSEVEDRLAEEEGELEVAKANLKVQDTGEKESMIKEAESRLNYTLEKIKQEEILFKRDSVLYDKGLISLQEYETQKWLLDLLRVEKKTYQAQIENLSTGVKSEEVNLLKSQISSIEGRLEVLRNRKNDLTIISPISGYISDIYSPDTLLAVVNESEVVLHLPVKLEDLELLKNDQSVRLKFSDGEEDFTGRVVSISRQVKFIDNQQVVFVSIELKNEEGRLIPGMVKEGYIMLKEITFFEYLDRLINT